MDAIDDVVEKDLSGMQPEELGSSLAGFFKVINKNNDHRLSKIEEKAEKLLESIKNRAPSEIHVKRTDGVAVVDGIQHGYYQLVLRLISNPEINLCLSGECGSGKTRLVMEVAKGLNLTWKSQSFNIMSTKSDIAGYLDAKGDYQESSFVQCFRSGFVFIADEFDCCSAAVATFMNSAIANRVLTLPTGERLDAHENFRFVAIMNTVGTGADQRYVGREQLDAATLDRFVIIPIPYDWGMAYHLIGEKGELDVPALDKGGLPTAEHLIFMVRSAETIFKKNKFLQVISPRALFAGHRMMREGIGHDWIMEGCILKGLTPQQRDIFWNAYMPMLQEHENQKKKEAQQRKSQEEASQATQAISTIQIDGGFTTTGPGWITVHQG